MPSGSRNSLTEKLFIFFFTYYYYIMFNICLDDICFEGEIESVSLSYGEKIRSFVFADNFSFCIYYITFFFWKFFEQKFLDRYISDKT